jgi:hypothetical protein
MHKSVLNQSLLLFIGLLIMLIPFTSINFSNIKAQEYGSYDDNDYDDMYSTYPTEVNKYECRTGPAEGFFVSSVDFCKHLKFDDRKNRDNNITGAQGPAGPTEILSNRLYSVDGGFLLILLRPVAHSLWLDAIQET